MPIQWVASPPRRHARGVGRPAALLDKNEALQMSTSECSEPKMVGGLGGSDTSKEALRWAARHQAQLTGATLEVQ